MIQTGNRGSVIVAVTKTCHETLTKETHSLYRALVQLPSLLLASRRLCAIEISIEKNYSQYGEKSQIQPLNTLSFIIFYLDRVQTALSGF